jgi:hypothetical protein
MEDGKTDNFLLWEKLTKNLCPGGLNVGMRGGWSQSCLRTVWGGMLAPPQLPALTGFLSEI